MMRADTRRLVFKQKRSDQAIIVGLQQPSLFLGTRADLLQFIPEAGTMILDPRMGQFMQ